MIALVVVLLAAGGPSYDAAQRVAYVQEALAAVSAADRAALQQTYQYVSTLERNACAAATERLRVECLMTALRRWCRQTRVKLHGKACALAADVAVTGVLSEKQLVPSHQRYEIMRKNRDYRSEIDRTVRRLRGSLAMDFYLAAGRSCQPLDHACLAESIDRFCHATADVRSVSWQSCSAALIWFIGTSD